MPHADPLGLSTALEAAAHYLHQEPDADLRMECQNLLDRAKSNDSLAQEELKSRFLKRLSFGTAGLRGKMEAGFAGMNLVTVAQAAYAIGKWASDKKDFGPIIVGCDARLNSQDFADEMTSVFEGQGFSVFRFEECVATPICAFAVKELGGIAGVMITASHNPPQDNGVKVYGSTGAQLDDATASIIEGYLKNAPSYQDLARPASTQAKLIPPFVLEDYFAAVEKSRIAPDAKRTKLRVVYTPLHGVGYRYFSQLVTSLQHIELIPVIEQKDPDGKFPTVAFPNPEEEGALDLALATAKRENADVIVANDPDADRLAVCVPNQDGTFTILSGNELGAFLGCDVLENMSCSETKLVVTTLVSSRILSAMAASNNASYDQSLTGFSRIAKIAQEREEKFGERFAFGFEEALGYCLGDIVRDKDGMSAAVHFLDRMALLKASGISVWDELDRIAVRYGLFRNLNWSFRFSGINPMDTARQTMTKLRELKLHALFYNGEEIIAVHDLAKDSYEGFSKANILIFILKDQTRVIVRPSGTEPKLKFYVEKSAKVSPQTLADEGARMDRELVEIKRRVSAELFRDSAPV